MEINYVTFNFFTFSHINTSFRSFLAKLSFISLSSHEIFLLFTRSRIIDYAIQGMEELIMQKRISSLVYFLRIKQHEKHRSEKEMASMDGLV